MPETGSYPTLADDARPTAGIPEVRAAKVLLKTSALQGAILNSANFSIIATDENGIIQLFNVGAERMLGFAAAEQVDRLTPTHISDPLDVMARTVILSREYGTALAPGFHALVFKAARDIEDTYEMTYIRKDGSRFPALPGVQSLRSLALHVAAALGLLLGSLLIGMAGYGYFENLAWRDGFVNSAILLGGMGPVDPPRTDGGKVFAGLYALYAGLVFIVAAGLVFIPVLHRLLHRFHWGED